MAGFPPVMISLLLLNIMAICWQPGQAQQTGMVSSSPKPAIDEIMCARILCRPIPEKCPKEYIVEAPRRRIGNITCIMGCRRCVIPEPTPDPCVVCPAIYLEVSSECPAIIKGEIVRTSNNNTCKTSCDRCANYCPRNRCATLLTNCKKIRPGKLRKNKTTGDYCATCPRCAPSIREPVACAACPAVDLTISSACPAIIQGKSTRQSKKVGCKISCDQCAPYCPNIRCASLPSDCVEVKPGKLKKQKGKGKTGSTQCSSCPSCVARAEKRRPCVACPEIYLQVSDTCPAIIRGKTSRKSGCNKSCDQCAPACPGLSCKALSPFCTQVQPGKLRKDKATGNRCATCPRCKEGLSPCTKKAPKDCPSQCLKRSGKKGQRCYQCDRLKCPNKAGKRGKKGGKGKKNRKG